MDYQAGLDLWQTPPTTPDTQVFEWEHNVLVP
jgi:hypothetical protein